MDNNSWFKINRKLLEDDFWLMDKFTRAQAWIDLIGLANWKDSYYMIRGVKVNVPRGSLSRSLRTLAARWRWSLDKVIAFLKELENEKKISTQKNNVITVIYILKYSEYQDADQNPEPNTDPNAEPYSLKKDKKVKKNKNKEYNIYGSMKNVRLSEKEYLSLKEDLGTRIEYWIETFSKGIAMKKYNYIDHNLAIRKWVANENKGGNNGTSKPNTARDFCEQDLTSEYGRRVKV